MTISREYNELDGQIDHEIELCPIIRKVIQSIPHLSHRIPEASRHEKILSFLELAIESNTEIILPWMLYNVNALKYISQGMAHVDDRVKSLSLRYLAKLVQYEARFLSSSRSQETMPQYHTLEHISELRISIIKQILMTVCTEEFDGISDVLLFGYLDCLSILLQNDHIIPLLSQEKRLGYSIKKCLERRNLFLMKAVSRCLGIIASFTSARNEDGESIAKRVIYSQVFTESHKNDLIEELQISSDKESELLKSALLEFFWNVVNQEISSAANLLLHHGWFQLLMILSIDSDRFVRKKSTEIIAHFNKQLSSESEGNHLLLREMESFIHCQLFQISLVFGSLGSLKREYWITDTFWKCLVIIGGSVSNESVIYETLLALINALVFVSSDDGLWMTKSMNITQNVSSSAELIWIHEHVDRVIELFSTVFQRTESHVSALLCKLACIEGLLEAQNALFNRIQPSFNVEYIPASMKMLTFATIVDIAEQYHSYHNILIPCLELLLKWPLYETIRYARCTLMMLKRLNVQDTKMTMDTKVIYLICQLTLKLGSSSFVGKVDSSLEEEVMIHARQLLHSFLIHPSWAVIDTAWSAVRQEMSHQPTQRTTSLLDGIEKNLDLLFSNSDPAMHITGIEVMMDILSSGCYPCKLKIHATWFQLFWESLRSRSDDGLLRRHRLRCLSALLTSNGITLPERLYLSHLLVSNQENNNQCAVYNEQMLVAYAKDVDEEVREAFLLVLKSLFSLAIQDVSLAKDLQRLHVDQLVLSFASDPEATVLRSFLSCLPSFITFASTIIDHMNNEVDCEWWNAFRNSVQSIDVQELSKASRQLPLLDLEASDMLYCIQEPALNTLSDDDDDNAIPATNTFFCYDC